jgi:hypothetical protein
MMAATLAWAQPAKPPAKGGSADKAPAKAVAAAGPKVWLAREVAQITEQQVWLFGADGSSVGVARTEQLRALLAVFGKLEQQAGVDSELYLSEGSEPDTWLAPGKGENSIVIRISLGLITMIGNDWDAWAFVFGHQLAHIEFRLREQESGARSGPSVGDEERAADEQGLEYAVKAGYKPEGATLFLSRLTARENPSAIIMRRHPFYPGRLEYVRDIGAAFRR